MGWFNYEDDRDFETEVYAYEKYNETFTTSLVRKDEDLEVIGQSKKGANSAHNNHQTQLMQLPNQPTFPSPSFAQADNNQPAPPTQPSPAQPEVADATVEDGNDTPNNDDTLDGMLDDSQ